MKVFQLVFVNILLVVLGTSTTTASAADLSKGVTAYRDGNYATALQEWQPLAESGNMHAQYNLGLLHFYGRGVQQDYPQAVQWFTKSAEQGLLVAQFFLANRIHEAREPREGITRSISEAAKWYRKAAEQNHAHAQFRLGVFYSVGWGGLTKDLSQALHWFGKAAEQGHASAQQSLGSAYELAQGAPRDLSRAMKWYGKAAEQEHARAQKSLASLYERGYGVPKNDGLAIKWYKKSADQGWRPAEKKLEDLLEKTRLLVSATTANVRKDPSTSSAVQFQLKKGDAVHPIEPAYGKQWHLVYIADRDTFGWMHQSTLPAPDIQATIFDASLTEATRTAMRVILSNTKVKPVREDDNYWVDKYNPAAELDGASELLVGYTSFGRLAFAQYQFPSHVKPDQVTRIANMVATKYGDWDAVDGNPALGPVEYQWNTAGVLIRVFRSWPKTTTYLKYEVLNDLSKMNSEIEKASRKREQREAREQVNAF
jgi:TPR repeat protein